MERDISRKFHPISTAKGNHLWAGAMAVAWAEFAAYNNVRELAMDTKDRTATRIIRNYNKCPFSRQDISPGSLYTKAGKGPATQEMINQEMRQKFPQSSMGELSFNLDENDIISFAYLFKQMKFAQKFSLRPSTEFRFNGRPTSSFYAQNLKQKRQVICHTYEDRDNFLVEIDDKEKHNQLFLLKSQSALLIEDAVKRVFAAEKAGEGPRLSQVDKFQMPIIEIDCSNSIAELIGARFTNQPLKGFKIAVMVEKLKLKIDESGAKVENMSGIVGTKRAKKYPMQPEIPKLIILDKTFWVIMKEPEKHPYLVAQLSEPKDTRDHDR